MAAGSQAVSVCVGVVVHAEPDRLLATLDLLARHTGDGMSVVLLPDGPDLLTSQALRSHTGLTAYPQWATSAAQGGAACLNRLVAGCTADVVVLLESGTLVGPGWLDLLLAALRRPGCGLAGPSTNRCWNEQAAFPHAQGDQADVRRIAGQALRRYGHAARSLAPLHSLADFCYAVRREVLQVTGGADEGYEQAPCWEMDLNIRAARAGFSGLWAGGAYVYRSPATARRRADEDRLLSAGKQRYQDRFCGLRLTGRTSQYRPHCDGDACQHFAPPEIMPGRPSLEAPRPEAAQVVAARTEAVRRVTAQAGNPSMVSCIMPTRDRPELALQAIRYFQRQDWPATELIIIEDGPPLLAGQLPDDSRITLVRSDNAHSIGGKRNLACELARGDVIAQWDDDDWYSPTRLSRQVDPIVAGDADITALRDCILFEVPGWQSWRWSTALHRRMLVRDVLGGTLVFRRQVWADLARYPDRSLAEDAAFLDQAVRRRARLVALSGTEVYAYIRHSGNTWRFRCGQSVSTAGWQRAGEPAFSAADRAFYRSRSLVADPRQAQSAAGRPVAMSGADG